MTLTADELLAGSRLEHEVEVPPEVLGPGAGDGGGVGGRVKLRPLTVDDLQRIARAAKESGDLTAALMVQRALAEPALTVPQVAVLHAGLVEFLLARVCEISGLETDGEELERGVEAPLARAAFVLAREFGWTPQEIRELTLGQVLLHLKMLQQAAAG